MSKADPVTSSVQFSSVTWSCMTLCNPTIAARQASLFITNSRSLPKLMPIKSVMPSSHLIPSRLLLLLSPIPPSIGVFSNQSTLRMRWPKYWSFSFIISPSNEHPGFISFRKDWWISLQSQGLSRDFSNITVQLSHPLMTTGKTIALTRRNLVGKVMSPLFICYLGWS